MDIVGILESSIVKGLRSYEGAEDEYKSERPDKFYFANLKVNVKKPCRFFSSCFFVLKERVSLITGYSSILFEKHDFI